MGVSGLRLTLCTCYRLLSLRHFVKSTDRSLLRQGACLNPPKLCKYLSLFLAYEQRAYGPFSLCLYSNICERSWERVGGTSSQSDPPAVVFVIIASLFLSATNPAVSEINKLGLVSVLVCYYTLLLLGICLSAWVYAEIFFFKSTSTQCSSLFLYNTVA